MSNLLRKLQNGRTMRNAIAIPGARARLAELLVTSEQLKRDHEQTLAASSFEHPKLDAKLRRSIATAEMEQRLLREWIARCPE